MSTSGKKKGKKKWTAVALNTVLPNAVVRSTTSWAEEVESELLSEYEIKKINNLNLPTAPRAACDLVIDESQIPPNGPFMAYLSNLPYDITEDDIAQHFKELKVASIQLPKDDRQDRMKGFGYIEFKDKSNLVAALQEGELTLKGRNVRVSLPAEEEQRQERGSRGMSFGRNRDNDRSDKPLGEWRAGAPVPHDPDKSTSSKHSGVGFTRQQNRDRDGGSGGGPFREFRSGGFQPAESGPSFSRGFRDRDDRDGGRSSERGGNRPFKRFEPREDRPPRSTFGKKFERDDRDREMKREPEKAEEPKQRPKLELLPRSIPEDSERAQQSLPASIFGAAKPVDTSKREMEIEAKLHMANTTVRGTSPRLTPTSNLSRASSISSISSSRRREGDSNETANDSSKSSGQFENYKSELSDGTTGGAKAPENVWAQRSAAKAVVSASTDDDANNASSSVIEDNSEAVEDSSAVYVPPQPGSRARHDSGSQKSGDDRSARYVAPRPDNETNDSRKWTTYTKETFDAPSQQQYSGSGGGGRYGGGGGRYSDNKFGSNFNRDNRRDRDRDRRDHHRDRDGERRNDRYFSKRGGDDNYGGGNRGGESSSFSSKWNHNNREGGSFRNRNSDFSGSRRHDRDSGGGGGGFSSFRDRNDSRANAYRSFGSSNNNVHEHESGEYRNSRNDDRRHYDERLIDGEENGRDGSATTDAQQPDAADSRLKVSPEPGGRPLENGQENGVTEGEDGARGSSDNLANSVDADNDNAFRTRKKSKKKKTLEREDTANERDLRSLDGDRKPRNQKDERKIADNHNLNNDKASNKNNIRAKDNRNDKNTKKSREPRDEVSQMPKQKEEKAPNFQDTNRFQFLNPED